jgi:hypothetical protein
MDRSREEQHPVVEWRCRRKRTAVIERE